MNTTETITEQQADEEAVNEHVSTGKPLDPQVYCRVRARAEKITAELRRKYGDMSISAELIREVRDEE